MGTIYTIYRIYRDFVQGEREIQLNYMTFFLRGVHMHIYLQSFPKPDSTVSNISQHGFVHKSLA